MKAKYPLCLIAAALSGACFAQTPAAPDMTPEMAAVIANDRAYEAAYAKGDAMASELDYVPMPDAVKSLVRKLWADQIKDASGKAIAFQ